MRRSRGSGNLDLRRGIPKMPRNLNAMTSKPERTFDKFLFENTHQGFIVAKGSLWDTAMMQNTRLLTVHSVFF